MARRLAPEENALWKRVAATVKPLHRAPSPLEPAAPPTVRPPKPEPRGLAGAAAARARPAALPPPRRTHGQATLDSHWDRRLRKGHVRPDLSIDLHGHSLASAQALLDDAIGRALLSDPRFLLLDEPLSSLDRARREEIMALIERLRDAVRMPILMVTHDRDEAARLGTRVVEI